MARKEHDPYPEHTKLQAVKDQSQTCGAFYEWLQDTKRIHMMQRFKEETDEDGFKVWRDKHGEIVDGFKDPMSLALALTDHDEFERMQKIRDSMGIDCRLVPSDDGPIELPVRESIEKLLAEYFDIDLKKLEEEKQSMLDECRAAHAHKEGRVSCRSRD